MAGTLAAAERSAIHSTHIEAAWSLARRAVQDTCRLVSMDRDTVHQIVEEVDDAMRRVSTPEGQASPVLSNTPERQTHGEYAYGNRWQNGINAVRKLKQWYQDSCQICATTLVLKIRTIPGPTSARIPSHPPFALVRAMQTVYHQQTKGEPHPFSRRVGVPGP
jgi:hypothetical protein